MKILQSIFCILVFTSCVQPAVAQKLILPTSLLNWLRILDDDDYQLLSAVDQNNFYFSVRVDADGDFLFASQDNLIVSRAKSRSLTLRITDLEGNDLHDLNSKKRSPNAKEIVYTDNSTVSYSSGTLYALIDHENDKIRVRFTEDCGDDRSIELFNQIINLPRNRGIPKR